MYIWRKLKRLAALFGQDTVWILPLTARTKEQFQWLAAEIQKLHGEATLWEAQLAFSHQEETLSGIFVRASGDTVPAGQR